MLKLFNLDIVACYGNWCFIWWLLWHPSSSFFTIHLLYYFTPHTMSAHQMRPSGCLMAARSYHRLCIMQKSLSPIPMHFSIVSSVTEQPFTCKHYPTSLIGFNKLNINCSIKQTESTVCNHDRNNLNNSQRPNAQDLVRAWNQNWDWRTNTSW